MAMRRHDLPALLRMLEESQSNVARLAILEVLMHGPAERKILDTVHRARANWTGGLRDAAMITLIKLCSESSDQLLRTVDYPSVETNLRVRSAGIRWIAQSPLPQADDVLRLLQSQAQSMDEQNQIEPALHRRKN